MTIKADIETALRRYGALTTTELVEILNRSRASVFAQVHKDIKRGDLARRLRVDWRKHGHLIHLAERAHDLEWYGPATDESQHCILDAQAEKPPAAEATRGVDLRVLV